VPFLLLSAAHTTTGTRNILRVHCVLLLDLFLQIIVPQINCRVNKTEQTPKKQNQNKQKPRLRFIFDSLSSLQHAQGAAPVSRQSLSDRRHSSVNQTCRSFGPSARKADKNTPQHDYRESRRLDDNSPTRSVSFLVLVSHSRRCLRVPRMTGGAAIGYESSRPRYEAGRF